MVMMIMMMNGRALLHSKILNPEPEMAIRVSLIHEPSLNCREIWGSKICRV